MAELRVQKHPDKTFIGRIAKGIDFLGYWFSPQGLGVAKKTVHRMLEKVSRLYEQGADDFRIETYLNRWWQWLRAGVSEANSQVERLLCGLVGALHFINAPYKLAIFSGCCFILWQI